MSYDVIGFGETMLRLSPPPGYRLEDTSILTPHVAGTESNVLCCLTRLGLGCAWISALPDNPLGRKVAGELRRHGVDTQKVVWTEGRLGIFYAEEAFDPVGTQVYYDRESSALALLDPEAIDLSVLDGARMLHLSGITPALGPAAKEAFSRLLGKALEIGVDVSFDVNYRASLWGADEASADIEEACRAAQLLICSRDDAATLWGFTGSPKSVLRQIEERFGTSKTVVLTLGSEGAAELRGGAYDQAPTFPSDGEVRFGSGDAFAAGYLYAHLRGEHYRQAHEELGTGSLHFANAAAALKRCTPGDIATITPGEVLEVLGGKERRFR